MATLAEEDDGEVVEKVGETVRVFHHYIVAVSKSLCIAGDATSRLRPGSPADHPSRLAPAFAPPTTTTRAILPTTPRNVPRLHLRTSPPLLRRLFLPTTTRPPTSPLTLQPAPPRPQKPNPQIRAVARRTNRPRSKRRPAPHPLRLVRVVPRSGTLTGHAIRYDRPKTREGTRIDEFRAGRSSRRRRDRGVRSLRRCTRSRVV